MADQINNFEQLAQHDRPVKVGFFLVPDFPLMTFAAAVDSLRQGNRLARKKAFEWVLLSADGSGVKSSSGLGFDVDAPISKAPRCDIVILIAGINYAHAYEPNVFAWMRRIYSEGAFLGAVSTAVFLLARAGLLEGRRCSVHWESLASFRHEFPNCLATDDIYSSDGRIATSSGGTVTLDMMLYIISAIEGRELAALISDQFNHAHIRRMTDVQRMSPEGRFGIRNSKIAYVVRRMEASLSAPVEITQLADSVALSLRQLERIFHANFGKSPSKFYIELRMARARELLTLTELPISQIATLCGYDSTSHFSRFYRQKFQESPAATRKTEIARGPLGA